MPYYERLSAQDASFLGLEDADLHMHVGGIFLYDMGPFRTVNGGFDIDRARASIEGRLHRVPRYRQRIAWVPGEGHPVWIDDDHFNLGYHVRHTALPQPGDEDTLKRLVGRIMSQQLDRGKPLWEMWFVEGLQEDRFALISKTHHCMIDGIAGAELISVLMDSSPDAPIEKPRPWTPNPAPSWGRLTVDALWHRMTQPFEAFAAARGALRAPDETVVALRAAAEGVVEAFAPAFRSASPTPLNTGVGPHRRFELIQHRVADFKRVKDALGGTLNDVVLATVAGALRSFFFHRGLKVQDLEIRALVPVSVRGKGQAGDLGNQITQMIAELPVGLADPIERLKAVREVMAGLKESKQALGGRVLTAVSEWTVPNVLVRAVRMSAGSRPYNLIVTNVPGPQIPLYFAGSRMLETYPLAPLMPGQALNIALFSYDGGIYWGLNGDWDALPDLPELASALTESFDELSAAAGIA